MSVSTAAILRDPADTEPPVSDKMKAIHTSASTTGKLGFHRYRITDFESTNYHHTESSSQAYKSTKMGFNKMFLDACVRLMACG